MKSSGAGAPRRVTILETAAGNGLLNLRYRNSASNNFKPAAAINGEVLCSNDPSSEKKIDDDGPPSVRSGYGGKLRFRSLCARLLRSDFVEPPESPGYFRSAPAVTNWRNC